MVKKLSVLLLLLVSIIAKGQYTYDFNEDCRKAYTSIINLKFQEGQQLIDQEKKINPNNNIPYLLENYIYFLNVFIAEEETNFDELDKKKDKLIDRLEDGDETSPWYRYSLAQVYLQWAVARTKFKEYVSATFEINKAYRLLEKNNEEFPDFLPNKINLGLLHTMIGTIPDNYNWAKKMVGIEGTIEQGVNEILTVLNVSMKQKEYSHYKSECMFYLSFIQMNLMPNQDKTLEYITAIEQDPENLQSPMAIYALARIYMKSEMNDKAITILENRPKSQEYFPFYYLDYLLGMAKLHRLDKDADEYLQKFITNFKGQNYIKDAYQKIAWYYFVNGNTPKYHEYMSKVATDGNSIVDADKQAEREAEQGTLPNFHLLRARLLFDGGYYLQALTELTSNTGSGFLKTFADSLEFSYRIGRIYHDWGKPEAAVSFYKKTIENGSDSEYFYAANAALKLGNIYEDQGKYDEALVYYKAAQSMKNKEYRNSINQKAKAGENRIENR